MHTTIHAMLEAGAQSFGDKSLVIAPDRTLSFAEVDLLASRMAASLQRMGIGPGAVVTLWMENGRRWMVSYFGILKCGAIVNPDGLKNQVEGANVMGIGGALFEAIQFENGRILNPKFSKYRVPRFSDVPPIETVLLDRKDLPSAGAGECPIVGLAPAVGNAIFDATGMRLRSMPMAPEVLKTA